MPAQMISNVVYAMLLLALHAGSALLFGWWLYKHWKRGRKTAYLWLLAGIVIVPFFSEVATVATEILLSYISATWAWARWSHGRVVHGLVSILFLAAKYLCIFVALSKFAGGAVRFTDVVAPWQAEL